MQVEEIRLYNVIKFHQNSFSCYYGPKIRQNLKFKTISRILQFKQDLKKSTKLEFRWIFVPVQTDGQTK